MLEKTWRWFGDNDLISLSDIRQTGAEGIVTALHHIPNGEVWSCDEIMRVKNEIEQHHMKWSVVESLPVHEEIKFGGSNRKQLIENYKKSLVNLGRCGIDTVCYNFMPVIDWIRTDLSYKLDNGTEALYFDFTEFVVFDRFILEREAAEYEYPAEIVKQARIRFHSMTQRDKERLVDTIIIKTQGFIDGISAENPDQAVTIFKNLLSLYEGIGNEQLRDNLKFFLQEIIPVAEAAGVNMCIHPDDPPMPVLGLPRIVSSYDDIQWILNAVDSPANGLTFCAGSLSAGSHNDLVYMIENLAPRVHFAHLRSTELLDNGCFYEAAHLKGRAKLVYIIKALLLEQIRREKEDGIKMKIPVRPDHGHRLLQDFDLNHNPGYPLIGRLKALSEISGVEMAFMHILGEKES